MSVKLLDPEKLAKGQTYYAVYRKGRIWQNRFFADASSATNFFITEYAGSQVMKNKLLLKEALNKAGNEGWQVRKFVHLPVDAKVIQ
jgi:hypothetical protein